VTYAAELIKAFPKIRMVLVHAGMLTARTQAAIDQWRAALTMMAAFPNLHVKISGLGMYSSGISLPQARQVIRDVIQIFGVERTIYGSNFPLEKLHASYANFFGVYRTVLSEYPEAEQRSVFHDNAVKFYRL
jgi:predicted TIM-barrel fold metal-dependent hydrolase